MRNNKVKTIKPRLGLNTVPLLSDLSERIGGSVLRRWRTATDVNDAASRIGCVSYNVREGGVQGQRLMKY